MTITRRKLGHLALATSAIAAPAIRTRPAQAAEFNFKFATNQPLTHPSNTRAQEAIGRIKERSGGRLNIQLFPNNQLGGDTEMLSQLRAGGIQFFLLSGLVVQTIVPAAGANGIGFAFSDYDTVWKAMDGDFGAYLRQKMDGAGLHVFPKIWDNGFREITSSSRQIKSPEDLRGFKIRIPVMPLSTSLFESYGAAPASINIKEAYSALQTNLVDGEENPLAIISNWKFYEVQKYCSLTDHMWDGFWLLSNKRAWQRLPADLQKIVSDNMDTSAQHQRTDIRDLNNRLQSELEKQGMIFNQPDKAAFREVLRKAGFYAKWRESFGPECWSLLEKYTGPLA
ncbi:TRAP transporter substrate-binding protein [Roseomonas chloroacetimidivorans]|uniref:TRAP transporter substrate-binding protein n=1 Tax=Roseomonas chloroacetimidivorans TaxID=1766656 RepID=UPI003C710DE8